MVVVRTKMERTDGSGDVGEFCFGQVNFEASFKHPSGDVKRLVCLDI